MDLNSNKPLYIFNLDIKTEIEGIYLEKIKELLVLRLSKEHYGRLWARI